MFGYYSASCQDMSLIDDVYEIFCLDIDTNKITKKSTFVFKEFEDDSISITLGDSLVFQGNIEQNPHGYENNFFFINWGNLNRCNIEIKFHRNNKKVLHCVKRCSGYIEMRCNIDVMLSEITIEDGVPVERLVSVPDNFTFMYCNRESGVPPQEPDDQ